MDAETLSDVIYYSLDALGFVFAFIYAWIVLPRYNVSRGVGLALVALVYVSAYILMLLLYWLVTGCFGGQNYVRVFIFVPLIIYIFFWAAGIDWRIGMDLAAPIMCLSMFTGKFACAYCGCCQSWLQVSWGIVNPNSGLTLFPVQLCEGFTALAIAIFLIVRIKRGNYKADGTNMWLMLILFGLSRFGWEFLRFHEQTYFGVSELALWALAMALLGAIGLAVHHWRKRQARQ